MSFCGSLTYLADNSPWGVEMDLLFSRSSIFDVLEHQTSALKQEAEHLDSATLEEVPEQEVVRDLASKYKLEVPALQEDKAYISHREIDIDVSHDPMRLIFNRSEPFYIRGVEITFSVPFRGDPDLFHIRPSSFNLNPPRGEINGNEIHIITQRTDNNAAAAKTQYEETLGNIKQYLGWLRVSVEEFNSKIGQQVESLVRLTCSPKFSPAKT